MQYIFVLTLKAENSNLQIDDGTVGDWRYSWAGNQIIAITQGSNTVNQNRSSTFDELITARKLGLLVDTLSFCSDLTVSTKIEYVLYKVHPSNKVGIKNPSLSFSTLFSQVRSQKILHRGESSDDCPVRINMGVSHSFNSEKLELTKYLLKFFARIRFINTKLKLLNYWRRGFDLYELPYKEESFLACFKILEYFKGCYQKGNNKLIDKRIKLVKAKTKKDALRIGGGVNLLNVDKFLVRLLGDAIVVRNRYDIAHMRIRPLPNSRNEALYFTYYDQIWDLNDDLLELTRFFILKYYGVTGIGLKSDGGLLRLYLT